MPANGQTGIADTSDAYSLSGTSTSKLTTPKTSAKSTLDPATVHYSRIPLADHTVLHKVQIRDQNPTVYHDVVLKASKNTVYHDVTMVLMNNPKPTYIHDVELNYIASKAESGIQDYEIIAQGEEVEPEMLIRANGEDNLIE